MEWSRNESFLTLVSLFLDLLFAVLFLQSFHVSLTHPDRVLSVLVSFAERFRRLAGGGIVHFNLQDEERVGERELLSLSTHGPQKA